MQTAALRFRSLALGLAITGSFATTLKAVDAFTDPVGYYTLSIVGGSDNVMSLPMVRDAVFVGVVDNGVTPFTSTSFAALAGAAAPGFTANQYAYAAGTQPQTYYVEFTSGALKGLYYKIASNTTNVITLDTEGDSLLNHPLPGNAAAALADGDSFKIRPYWRVRDVFESSGAPIIEPRANPISPKDDILFPDYTSVGINKAPSLTVYYLTGQGWRAAGQGTVDFGDHILRPNESVVIRRRNPANLSVTNLGGVLMNKTIAFITGGNGSTGNDTFFSIARPAPVKLDDAGLRIADQTRSLIKDSPSALARQDELLAFSTPNPGAGINLAPTATYYYLAGQGWRQVGAASTTVGQDVLLQPGVSYIVRKKSANPGTDWVNDPNY